MKRTIISMFIALAIIIACASVRPVYAGEKSGLDSEWIIPPDEMSIPIASGEIIIDSPSYEFYAVFSEEWDGEVYVEFNDGSWLYVDEAQNEYEFHPYFMGDYYYSFGDKEAPYVFLIDCIAQYAYGLYNQEEDYIPDGDGEDIMHYIYSPAVNAKYCAWQQARAREIWQMQNE